MLGRTATGTLAALFLALQTAAAGPTADTAFERMALCRDSWLDWQKAGDPKLQQLADHLNAGYSQKSGDPFFVPKAPTAILGFRVLQLYPGNVGMGVGFSVLIDAPYDKARAGIERAFGKPLTKCENGDGMKSCEAEIAPMRSLMVMAQDDPKSTSSLIGCYYYYEK